MNKWIYVHHLHPHGRLLLHLGNEHADIELVLAAMHVVVDPHDEVLACAANDLALKSELLLAFQQQLILANSFFRDHSYHVLYLTGFFCYNKRTVC